MLDLELSDEQRAVADLTRGLGLDVLWPAAREAEADRVVPAKVWATLFETGLTTPVPERYGGGGIPDAVTAAIAVESLAYGDAGITMAATWAGSAALLIGLCGTDEQAAILSTLGADADRHSAVALYEGYGRSPSQFSTSITAHVDGSWRILGRKVAVPFADSADPLVIVGVDPVDGRLRAAVLHGLKGGVTISPPVRHLALDAAPTASIELDLTIGAGDLLGGVDADPSVLDRAIGRLRLAVASSALGTASRSIDYASKYATERIAFGKPIAAFQGVSFLLAEALVRIAAARLEVMDVASRLDDPGDLATEDAVTRAVNYAGGVATQSTRDAVQVLGGHGFITDHPVELWYRTAATLSAIDFDPLCSTFEPAL